MSKKTDLTSRGGLKSNALNISWVISISWFKSKLDSIKTLVSQALIDMEISHEEFITILNTKKMKGNVRSENEKQ